MGDKGVEEVDVLKAQLQVARSEINNLRWVVFFCESVSFRVVFCLLSNQVSCRRFCFVNKCW